MSWGSSLIKTDINHLEENLPRCTRKYILLMAQSRVETRADYVLFRAFRYKHSTYMVTAFINTEANSVITFNQKLHFILQSA